MNEFARERARERMPLFEYGASNHHRIYWIWCCLIRFQRAIIYFGISIYCALSLSITLTTITNYNECALRDRSSNEVISDHWPNQDQSVQYSSLSIRFRGHLYFFHLFSCVAHWQVNMWFFWCTSLMCIQCVTIEKLAIALTFITHVCWSLAIQQLSQKQLYFTFHPFFRRLVILIGPTKVTLMNYHSEYLTIFYSILYLMEAGN